ncbi:MAG: serine hydrolase domain-containing protein [Myxococcota bacterium]
MPKLAHLAPPPALGSYEDGYAPIAQRFAEALERREEVGGALSVYHHGRLVVDLYGGWADFEAKRPWLRDTRAVVFSVTKGFAAMGFYLLADRGLVDWNAPVATYWPGFARAGKESITVGTLLSHRAGLPVIDRPLRLSECVDPRAASKVLAAIEAQTPLWTPGSDQGYHALSFGLYARELFERIANESMNRYLRRELFAPLGSDVYLGTPPSEDPKMATLYPPAVGPRISKMAAMIFLQPECAEARITRLGFRRDSIPRRAFINPSAGLKGPEAYNEIPVRRENLAWASATASADGIARAYLPFAGRGKHEETRYLREQTLEPAYERVGWSDRDRVLQKPLGWSYGFLKEERHVFSPTRESFGHAGMGGSLGWADPVHGLAVGYVMNRMDWRVRSPRCLRLCHALYDSEALRG